MTRAEIESHVASVQARRMAAAVTFHAGQNAKLAHLTETARRKFESKVSQLERALVQLDAQLDKVIKASDAVEVLRHEYELASDRLAVAPKPE